MSTIKANSFKDLNNISIAPPCGTILNYPGSAPSGFLLCDGSAISRTTYADLFDLIGETYGAGDGLTTFNLPDQASDIELFGDYTQSVIGASNGSTYTNLTTVGKWELKGRKLKMIISTAVTGTPATGTGAFNYKLPTGYTFDTAMLPTTLDGRAIIGQGVYIDTGTAMYGLTACYSTSNSSAIILAPDSGTSFLGPTAPATLANGDAISFEVEVYVNEFAPAIIRY